MAHQTFGTEMNVLVSSIQKDYLPTTELFAKQLYFNHMMFQPDAVKEIEVINLVGKVSKISSPV